MSGLVAAHAVGAPYPFGSEHREAAADFKLMQKMIDYCRARGTRYQLVEKVS